MNRSVVPSRFAPRIRASQVPDRPPAWLLAWLGLGVLALLLLPSARGRDPLAGWLPFWLVVAPLLDLAWLARARLRARFAAAFLALGRRRAIPRQARRRRRATPQRARRFSRAGRGVSSPSGAGILP